MTDEPSGVGDAPDEAEAVFATWIARVEDGEELELDRLGASLPRHAAYVAFLAMARWRLGHEGETLAELSELEELHGEDASTKGRSYLAEAKALIDPQRRRSSDRTGLVVEGRAEPATWRPGAPGQSPSRKILPRHLKLPRAALV